MDERLKNTEPPAGGNGGKPGTEGQEPNVKNGFFETIYKNQSKR